ncbi:MAG TPA: amidohydrolase family protein [Sphingomicrobium sp.]|nr:amidohydrolase family protein [Sphingomicrobium sp.]
MIRAVLAALLVSIAAPAVAETIAITNAIVATGDGSGPIQGGTVVIRDGRIVAAHAGGGIPAGARVIDASGKWVTPGIVAGFSRLGLADVDLSADGADDTAAMNGPFSAAINVAPAINPNYTPVEVNRADGVTRAIVAPSAPRNIFAGQGAVIDTGDDMYPITKARAFQFVELGETGAGKAGGSRPSAHVLFRNALREATELRRYAQPIRSGAAEPQDWQLRRIVENPNEARILGPDARRSEDVLLTRFDAAALVAVLRGAQPLLVHVERASDILQVIDLRREFPSLRIVIVGASEGWMVADQIARSGIPVIASAVNDLPASFEQLAATQSNVGRMLDAGVKVSIGTINDDETRNVFRERQYAGNLVALTNVPGATGVTWGEALRMITSAPAEAVGLGQEIGSLAPGRRADVVIWSGDPLDPRSAAETVFIDGVEQPLDNHQTKLRDRYRHLPRRELPEAYRN